MCIVLHTVHTVKGVAERELFGQMIVLNFVHLFGRSEPDSLLLNILFQLMFSAPFKIFTYFQEWLELCGLSGILCIVTIALTHMVLLLEVWKQHGNILPYSSHTEEHSDHGKNIHLDGFLSVCPLGFADQLIRKLGFLLKMGGGVANVPIILS